MKNFVVFGFDRGANGLFEAFTDGLDGAKLFLGQHWHEVWGDFAQIYGLAALDEHAVVKWITQDVGDDHGAVISGDFADVLILAGEFRHAMDVMLAPVSHNVGLAVAVEIHLETVLDVIEIAVRLVQARNFAAVVAPFGRAARFTLGNVGIDATLDAFAEVLGILFGHGKHDVEQQFTAGIVSKGEGWELEVFDDTVVDHIDNHSRFKRVTRQAIGVPGQNAVVFAGFDILEHLRENRPTAGNLGRMGFFEDLDDFEAVVLGIFDASLDLVGQGFRLRANVFR